MKSVLGWITALVIAVAGYLLLWPVPIDPAAWNAPESPGFNGSYAGNDRLAAAQRIAEGFGIGPEAVEVGPDGRIYTGYIDGRLVAITPETGDVELLENTGGRPLGVMFGPQGRLYIADAVRGLMAYTPQDGLSVLASEVNGKAFGFVDDLSVDSDGVVYFSDASQKFGVHEVRADFFEHRPNGQVLRYDPATGETDVLVEAMYFPNGIAVGPDDAYLLITETAKYRVWKYWLKGDKAGTLEPFIENLPGFPDNITFDGDGTFWLALYGPRNPDLDALLSRPFLRKMVYRLPEWAQPMPAKHGIALALDESAKVVANLQDKGPGAFGPVTSVRAHGDWLYLGSLSAPSIARIANPLPVAGDQP